MFELDSYENCHSDFNFEKLKRLLKEDKLHPMFEGKHITPHGCCDAVEFFGNFIHHSFVFRFSTRKKSLISELTNLIEANLKKDMP
jgi:hypothetical protein